MAGEEEKEKHHSEIVEQALQASVFEGEYVEEERPKGGRPRKYNTPQEFDQKVNEFYQACKSHNEPITWTGLALYMGFSSRQSIDEYQNYDGFSDSVKRAKTMIENAYERRLHGNNVTGAIFALKSFKWEDKQQVDHTSSDGSMTPARGLKDFYQDDEK